MQIRFCLCWTIGWLAIAGAMASGQSPASFTPDESGYQREAVLFLKQNCLRCHGPEEAEAEFRVDTQLSAAFDDLTTSGRWREVVNVLNSHEMPPEEEPQPSPESVAKFVDYVTGEMIRAEQVKRDSVIILRRMNRDEYRNTIRDLVGIDYDTSHFPQDPPTGGFDNNGGALTISPLHMEQYYHAAREILDEALVAGEQPPLIRWRFQPESGHSDSNRVEYDKQRLIINSGKNRDEADAVVMHHNSWDRNINVRDFAVKNGGKYLVRIRVGGRVPTRDEVVESAKGFLQRRLDEAIQKNPSQEKWKRQEYERGLEHFQTFRDYDYGRPRLKVTQHLAGQPKVIAEFDVNADLPQMQTIEIETELSTDKAGLTINYAYDIPKEVENFWMQGHDEFARPEAAVDWMELEGPIYPEWPPQSQTRLLPESPLRESNPREYARTVIARFLQRAYRRPADRAEIEQKLTLFDQAYKQSDSLETAIRAPLIAILISPHFLYLAEPTAGSDQAATPLDDFQLATRLSYFLWSSMPDDALFRAAKSGKLQDPQELDRQVDRMLADPKAEALVENFAGQWLSLREVGANPPVAELFRRYDRHLETSIIAEGKAFFREVLQNDLSVMNFIDSDFVVINERLARFYGIDGVRGDHFRRVTVPAGVYRGGVLTQASMLSITSNGTRTSPVKRGVWILKNILGTDPGLPVANVGEIAPKVPGIDKATVRQRLEIHRELAQCARCHNKIDPLGFALENFDGSGDWREREGHGYQGRIGANDPLIDASATLPDGTEIDGIESLQQALLEKEELFLRCLSEKMFTYALGRELSIVDRPQIEDAVAAMQASDKSLRALLHFVVRSEPFQSK
ncbi:DUF1592 domain-containing protein [Blastopirellula marina]|uniref:Cytochrome c domain-containing protein n=1 Tax=Blastopirellula marina DSM 3645 TaxID=314230 RepID=A3ZPH1_9BACT|nr:DUF1592 domain-containing protein [Blastopirellula marina]EAQ81649.1 hypothetical protein DSM3645_28747 [Blastopirellula marina DSM 3645]